MIAYEPYGDTECPRCGNTRNNRDAGPYEPHPLDEKCGGTPPPEVHLIWCGNCGKPFDVVTEELAKAALEEIAPHYADACPHPDCHPGDDAASLPKNLDEKRGRCLGEYECPRGHMWVTWWGNGRHLENHWAIERQLIDPATSADEAVEALRLLEEALGPERDAA